MTDPAANESHAPARPKPRRARRFVLPDVHHDERTAAGIVAFVAGSAAPPRRHEPPRATGDRPVLPKELDTRPDWLAAFLHESSRHARYGRPASVLLLELVDPVGGPSADRVARGLGEVIRGEARESDRAVRLGASSFRLLLPETSARAARHVASRLERTFQAARRDEPDRSELRIEIAAPTRGGSLEEAVADAERRLAG